MHLLPGVPGILVLNAWYHQASNGSSTPLHFANVCGQIISRFKIEHLYVFIARICVICTCILPRDSILEHIRTGFYVYVFLPVCAFAQIHFSTKSLQVSGLKTRQDFTSVVGRIVWGKRFIVPYCRPERHGDRTFSSFNMADMKEFLQQFQQQMEECLMQTNWSLRHSYNQGVGLSHF